MYKIFELFFFSLIDARTFVSGSADHLNFNGRARHRYVRMPADGADYGPHLCQNEPSLSPWMDRLRGALQSALQLATGQRRRSVARRIYWTSVLRDLTICCSDPTSGQQVLRSDLYRFSFYFSVSYPEYCIKLRCSRPTLSNRLGEFLFFFHRLF